MNSARHEERLARAVRAAGDTLEVNMPQHELVQTTLARRTTRTRVLTAAIAVTLIGGVAVVALSQLAATEPTAVVDAAAPDVDAPAQPGTAGVAGADRMEVRLEATLGFVGGTRVATDPVTRVRESTWTGEGSLTVDGDRETTTVTILVDVDAEKAPGGFANAAHRGAVEVVGARTCSGSLGAVWDAADAVADRGAMTLECDDGTVMGLAIDGYDLIEGGGAVAVMAEGFGVRTGAGQTIDRS